MIDTREVAERLRIIESLAVIQRVASTNLVARRVVSECIENELSLPRAMIIAREQFAGVGRNQRTWSSPANKGIYATTLFAVPSADLNVLPLAIAVAVASFLRESYGVPAGIKWPNDIMVEGRKIAGILIESRLQGEQAFALIGTGINVEAVTDEPNATSIREAATADLGGLDEAIVRFVEFLDAVLAKPLDRVATLAQWRSLTIHKEGDPVSCVIGERTVSGTWGGIDDSGRALLRTGSEVTAISAGDLILM